MKINKETIQRLRELEQSENPPMGISHVRSILLYIDRGELQSASNVFQNEGDKNYQYPRLNLFLEEMFGCRCHLVHDCQDRLCVALRNDAQKNLKYKEKCEAERAAKKDLDKRLAEMKGK